MAKKLDELNYYYQRFRIQRARRSATVVPQGAIPVVAPEPAPAPEPERNVNRDLVMRGEGLKDVRERIASFSDRKRNELFQQFKRLYGNPTSSARENIIDRVKKRFDSYFSEETSDIKLTEREKGILSVLRREASENAKKDNTYYKMFGNYRRNLNKPAIQQVEKLLNKESLIYSWSVYSNKIRSGMSDERAMNETRKAMNEERSVFDVGDIDTKNLLTNVQKDMEGGKTYLEFMG